MSIPLGETLETMFLDLSLEFGASIAQQNNDHRSMRLDCPDKATPQRILALNGSFLVSQSFSVSEFIPQSSVGEILRLVDERVEEMEELNIVSGDFKTVPEKVVK